ncbi:MULTISPECIES: glycosyltransferase family 2 protein [Klebsiella pneumoniae complex]|uniref:glycosyltransferase family 2 protein n=1 Tax=Klebsiella pneumoniae complex TaxID=3390273 RepID=UPI0021A886CD|nr:glycosyltransferase family 2 protein [Klebsiella variicola]UWS45718.1 glycosyltransferase family 2 protein [Klebsiella variicola]HDH1530279.1 glycosyltransferase family 2 protein [Klebsiella quasipneumoniae subsp. similipneumoniae]
MNRTSAVIVTYNPDLEHLDYFVRKISPLVNDVIIVDNTDDGRLAINGLNNLHLIMNGLNKGIAFAQNQGVIKSIELKSEFVFLFDQDSDVDLDFFERMEKTYLDNNDLKISCIGANYDSDIYDGIDKENFIIASGSMYSTSIFTLVGLFDSSYFIDLVDVEWCYRAKKYGYESYVNRSIKMYHNIGDNNYPKLFGKIVRIGSPIRQYYLVRNWIFSLSSSSFRFNDKIKIFILMLYKIPLFCLCHPRRKRMLNILKGIFDGCLKKTKWK